MLDMELYCGCGTSRWNKPSWSQWNKSLHESLHREPTKTHHHENKHNSCYTCNPCVTCCPE